MQDFFVIEAHVEVFPQAGGWHYVPVPVKFTEMSKGMADRGLVPIVARVEDYEWKTSLLPKGDGTHFIAVNAKVRNKYRIRKGDVLKIMFKFRE